MSEPVVEIPLRRAQEMRDEIARLEKLVYVPGAWRCAKCKCSVVATNLHVPSGGFSANNDPQQCPNNCGPMWRVTERDAGNDLCDRMDKQQTEIARLTERCDAYREALERARAIARARILCDPARYAVLRDIDDTISTALASPAGEQKDKT